MCLCDRRQSVDRRRAPRPDSVDRRAVGPITDLDAHPFPFVTVEQLATYWLVSTDTVYRDIEKGALRSYRVGRLIRIAVADARLYGKPL